VFFHPKDQADEESERGSKGSELGSVSPIRLLVFARNSLRSARLLLSHAPAEKVRFLVKILSESPLTSLSHVFLYAGSSSWITLSLRSATANIFGQSGAIICQTNQVPS